MTPQEIFDTVVEHLYRQGGPALADKRRRLSCAYRARDGRKCAVGILIPDELYKPEFENETICYLANNYPELFPEWFYPNIQLIAALQRVHDHYSLYSVRSPNGILQFPRAELCEGLTDVARRFNLQFKEPQL